MSDQQTNPETARAIAAAEALIAAYRERYMTPATARIRRGAPLHREMAELNVAIQALRSVSQ